MANQVVVDYIKKARQAGLPDDQIKSVLYKNGWTEADVNENFLAVAGPEQKAVPSQTVPIQITPAQAAPTQNTPVQSNVQANIVQNQSIKQSQPAAAMVSKKKFPILMIILIVVLIILLGVGGFSCSKSEGFWLVC